MKKFLEKPELIFIITAFIFGLLFSILTPPCKVPDETAHVWRSAEVADGIFYNKTPAENVSYDKYFDNIIGKRPDGIHQATGYSPLLYAIPAAGIKISSITNNGLFMFYFARFLNMLAWIALIAFAIHITPVFKQLFLFTALLPMSIFEGMSFAVDSFNMGFAFLFFAYIFKLIYEAKELKKSDFVLLTFMSIVSAFTKGAIYPILLFTFLPIKKHKYLFVSICMIIAFTLMLYWQSINPVFLRPDLDPEFHKNMLQTNPLDFIKYSINTVYYMSWFYVRSCIGILGCLDVRLNTFAYIITTIVFFIASIVNPTKIKIPKSHRIFSILTWILFTFVLFIMYYIVWTLPTDNRIHGIQGRYFIPLMPYLFIIFSHGKKLFNEKIQTRLNIFVILFSISLLTYTSIILNNHYHVL